MQTNTNSSTATHLTFFGDSIFDNRPYVYSDEETVGGWASREIPRATSMRAVDGHTTENLLKILTALPEKVDPSESAVISIGGNDALQAQWVLYQPTAAVGLAFRELQPVLQTFRANYIRVLEEALKRFAVSNLRVCTIYNGVPDLPAESRTALGLFNDIITEEAGLRGIKVIDLRIVCAKPECYSEISSIEPSDHGAEQITLAVRDSFGLKAA